MKKSTTKLGAMSLGLGLLLVPSFNAAQVPASEGGQDLDETTIVPVIKDDVDDSTDVDIYSIQNPEDIIIKPQKDFSTEFIGSAWEDSDTYNKSEKITADTFTGDEAFIFNNAASYYNEDTNQIDTLSIRFDITGYKKGLENGKDNYLSVKKDGLSIAQKNSDVSFSVSFINDKGETVKNKNVEFLWTDMDCTASISYETSAIQEVVAPTYDRGITQNLADPYFYMNYKNLQQDPTFLGEEFQYIDHKNTDFSDYRLGIAEDGGMTTIWDRWTDSNGLSDEGIANISDEEIDKINSIPHTYYTKGSNVVSISPGQNFGIVVNTGDSGKIKMDIGNQFTWSGRINGNGVNLASPSIANTKIEKSIVDSNGNGYAEDGETLTYKVKITNNSDKLKAYLTHVQDNMIMNPPKGLTFNNDVTLEEGVEAVGDINSGDFRILEIPEGGSTTITYSFTVNDINSFISANKGGVIDNIATDNGVEPTICSTEDLGEDCGEATIIPNGTTSITKSVTDENGNGLAEVGEDLNYTIHVANDSDSSAYDVNVKDSILENEFPSYMKLGDIQVVGNEFKVKTDGNLTTGDFKIEEIPAGMSVDITYTLVLNEFPSDDTIKVIKNIATDNGEEPTTCDATHEGVDCDSTVTPIEPTPEEPSEVEVISEVEVPSEVISEVEVPSEVISEVEGETIYVPEKLPHTGLDEDEENKNLSFVERIKDFFRE